MGWASGGRIFDSVAQGLIDARAPEEIKRCRDEDCVRFFLHGRLSRHLWRHEAQPPFEHVLFGWLCGCCGFRRGHRIHKPDVSKGA